MKMKKEKILVKDNRGVFLKMFKRKFKDKIEFFEKPFFDTNEEYPKQYDRIVYVVHNRQELLGFLQEEKNSNDLVCLFDKQFYKSLDFLEIVNPLILFYESKTSREVLKELKIFFRTKLDSNNENSSSRDYNYTKTKLQNYYQAVYSIM